MRSFYGLILVCKDEQCEIEEHLFPNDMIEGDSLEEIKQMAHQMALINNDFIKVVKLEVTEVYDSFDCRNLKQN